MISGAGGGEGEEGGGEEHGLIVGVSDEKYDGFIGELGVGGAGEIGGEEPEGGDEDRDSEDGVVVHCGSCSSFGEQEEVEVRGQDLTTVASVPAWPKEDSQVTWIVIAFFEGLNINGFARPSTQSQGATGPGQTAVELH